MKITGKKQKNEFHIGHIEIGKVTIFLESLEPPRSIQIVFVETLIGKIVVSYYSVSKVLQLYLFFDTWAD